MDAFGAAIARAVVVVVTEVPALWRWPNCNTASPTLEPFAGVHASLVVGTQLDVIATVAALSTRPTLPLSDRSVFGASRLGLQSRASGLEADLHGSPPGCHRTSVVKPANPTGIAVASPRSGADAGVGTAGDRSL